MDRCVSLFARSSLLTLLLAFAVASLPATAQTFNVIHNFTGGTDGGFPQSGLAMDQAGNFYGTTPTGGVGTCGYNGGAGCGLVYKLQRRGTGWGLTALYSFHGRDGFFPEARALFGPDGSLYGTTNGNPETVYRLQPPQHVCVSVSCPWSMTILLTFPGLAESNPMGDLAFDHAGNIYGTTETGGPNRTGTVYEVTGGQEHILYTFAQDGQFLDGYNPTSGVIFGSDGSLYGTTSNGGAYDPCGTTFTLTQTQSGWYESGLFSFGDGDGQGCHPVGGLVFDTAGNLYGTTTSGGFNNAGLVFGSNGLNYSFEFNGIYHDGGPVASLTRDAAGNIYGTTYENGASGNGSIFKITPDNQYISLHDFTGGNDGKNPKSTVLIDGQGNLWGTTSQGGANGYGVIWEITP